MHFKGAERVKYKCHELICILWKEAVSNSDWEDDHRNLCKMLFYSLGRYEKEDIHLWICFLVRVII